MITQQERETIITQLADIGAHLEDFPNPTPVLEQLLATIRQLTMICMMLLEVK